MWTENSVRPVADPEWDGGCIPPPAWEKHPQCTETGLFEVQNGKQILGGAQPPPQTPPPWEGTTPSRPPDARLWPPAL